MQVGVIRLAARRKGEGCSAGQDVGVTQTDALAAPSSATGIENESVIIRWYVSWADARCRFKQLLVVPYVGGTFTGKANQLVAPRC